MKGFTALVAAMLLPLVAIAVPFADTDGQELPLVKRQMCVLCMRCCYGEGAEY